MLRSRLTRAALEPGGLMSPLALVTLAATPVLLSDFQLLLSGFVGRHTVAHLALNRLLLGGLVLATAAWALMRTRAWVGALPTAGLGVAALGLAARGVIETVMTGLAEWPPRNVADDATPVLMVDACRALGLAAYAVGLTLAVAACVFERRGRRQAPRAAARSCARTPSA